MKRHEDNETPDNGKRARMDEGASILKPLNPDVLSPASRKASAAAYQVCVVRILAW